MDFTPPLLMRSPHVQTLLSSRMLRQYDDIGSALLARAETVTLTCRGGVRLQALVNVAGEGAPLVVIVHGWLGRADSPYVRRASEALHKAGFSIARLLLRDHGETAGLNLELFNAARIDEVVDACNLLAARVGVAGTGLMGFSLGGNFTLRVAAHPDRSPQISACLAVCPVIDPEGSVHVLDTGWPAYRWYFLSKWRRAFAAKQAAFPDHYDFSAALRMKRVAELTEYFVTRHTPFASTAEYYAQYRLTHEKLAAIDIPARIVAAADDPVIPVSTLEPLKALNGELLALSLHGGHCGFIESYSLRSALDAYATAFFERLR